MVIDAASLPKRTVPEANVEYNRYEQSPLPSKPEQFSLLIDEAITASD